MNSIIIPLTDNHHVRVCSKCSDEALLRSSSSSSSDCSCRTREYVEKEKVIAYLLLREQARVNRQVFFGRDLNAQMGINNLLHFRIATKQGLRLFFHMFDDVYANKENGEINLYRENDALEEAELESLLVDFTNDKREYLREIFDLEIKDSSSHHHHYY